MKEFEKILKKPIIVFVILAILGCYTQKFMLGDSFSLVIKGRNISESVFRIGWPVIAALMIQTVADKRSFKLFCTLAIVFIISRYLLKIDFFMNLWKNVTIPLLHKHATVSTVAVEAFIYFSLWE